MDRIQRTELYELLSIYKNTDGCEHLMSRDGFNELKSVVGLEIQKVAGKILGKETQAKNSLYEKRSVDITVTNSGSVDVNIPLMFEKHGVGSELYFPKGSFLGIPTDMFILKTGSSVWGVSDEMSDNDYVVYSPEYKSPYALYDMLKNRPHRINRPRDSNYLSVCMDMSGTKFSSYGLCDLIPASINDFVVWWYATNWMFNIPRSVIEEKQDRVKIFESLKDAAKQVVGY